MLFVVAFACNVMCCIWVLQEERRPWDDRMATLFGASEVRTWVPSSDSLVPSGGYHCRRDRLGDGAICAICLETESAHVRTLPGQKHLNSTLG